MISGWDHDQTITEAGDELEEAIKQTLALLARKGLPARDADEFVRECVFNAWWDSGYDLSATERAEAQ